MDAMDAVGNTRFISQGINKYCYVMGGIAMSCQYHKTINMGACK
jgi:hypothetical protein